MQLARAFFLSFCLLHTNIGVVNVAHRALRPFDGDHYQVMLMAFDDDVLPSNNSSIPNVPQAEIQHTDFRRCVCVSQFLATVCHPEDRSIDTLPCRKDYSINDVTSESRDHQQHGTISSLSADLSGSYKTQLRTTTPTTMGEYDHGKATNRKQSPPSYQ